MKTKTLVVCSITNWIVQDFLDAKIADIEIIGDRGFDLPAVKPSGETAWWMPTEHAVKLRYSDFSIPFVAPGSHWLPSVPQSLTGRYIGSLTVSEALSKNSPFSDSPDKKLWIKPAEFKHQEFFAGIYSQQEIAAFNLPLDAVLQWTSTILDIAEEHRFYVLDNEIITGSEYLVDNLTYYDGAVSSLQAEAFSFASKAVKELGYNQPPAYTLDVALDKKTNSWVVLEGNPAFSSAIYGSDPAKVVDVLLRCCNPQEKDQNWIWKPDSFLMKKYARMRPLR